MVSNSTARISNWQVRAVRQVHGLLELFTQTESDDTGSTEDAEKYKREFGNALQVFASALFALLAKLFWSLTIKTTLFDLFRCYCF